FSDPHEWQGTGSDMSHLRWGSRRLRDEPQLVVEDTLGLQALDVLDALEVVAGELFQGQALAPIGVVELGHAGRDGPLGRERGQFPSDQRTVDPVVAGIRPGATEL